MPRLLLSLLCLVVFPLNSFAAYLLTETGSLTFPSFSKGVAVQGDYAYVANAANGLRVVDISDPAAPALVATLDTAGSAEDVAVAGQYVYVADMNGGVRVIDVLDPAAPVLKATIANVGGGMAMKVALDGSRLYVADFYHMMIVDISNPLAPVTLGSYNTPSNPYGVDAAGDRVYVADTASGLRIIDVTDPAVPVELGFLDTPGNAYSVAISGNHAYVADYSGGLRVIDVTDPAVPVEVAVYPSPGLYTNDVVVSGSLAFVADHNAGLRVVDVSDPLTPVEVGYYDTPGSAMGVAVSGGYAFIADHNNQGVRIIDWMVTPELPAVSAPASSSDPRPTWSWSSGGNGDGLFRYKLDDSDLEAGATQTAALEFTPGSDLADGTHTLYVQESNSLGGWSGSGWATVQVNAVTPGAPVVSGPATSSDPRPTWTWTSGGGGTGTYRYKLDDPDLGVGATQTTTASFTPASDLPDGNHTLYVEEADPESGWSAAGSFTVQVDAVFPAAPVVSGVAQTSNLRPSWAWVSSGGGNGTFRYKLDDADLSTGATQTTDPFVSWASDLALGSHILYVEEGDEAGNWSASGSFATEIVAAPAVNTVALEETGALPFPSFSKEVAVLGNYAYVANAANGLRVVDVSDPAAPVEAATLDTAGNAEGVAVSGLYAYVADMTGGVRVVDISDPATPVLRTTIPNLSGGMAMHVELDGARLYVADMYTVMVVDVTDPLAPVVQGSFDVGMNGFDVAYSGNYLFATNVEGLYILDVSDPTTPTEVAFWQSPGSSYAVTVAGDHAYVSDYTSGLQILDVSDPTQPVHVGNYPSPGLYTNAAEVVGTLAFVADHNAGMRIVDVSNPAIPVEVGFYDTPGTAMDVAVSGSYAYIADHNNSGVRAVYWMVAPEIPVVTGPASTIDPRPTWDWSSGGNGSGLFRYKLDDSNLTSGAVQTTSTSWTADADLAAGGHTFYVQEYNALGGWSSTGYVNTEILAGDSDGDGIANGSDPCPFDPDNDSDGDGVCGDVDNCPTVANVDQADANSNGTGDACDPADSDGDRYSDMLEVAMGGDPNDSGVLPSTQATIQLQTGWNLVSIPLAKVWHSGAVPAVPTTTGAVAEAVASVADVLTSIAGKYTLVRSYDAGGSKTFNPAAPPFLNTLTYLSGGYGYWINATEPVDLVLTGPPMLAGDSLQLYNGWNLAGYWAGDVQYVGTEPTALYPSGSTFTPVASVSNILASLGGTVTLVRSYDADGSHTYNPAAPPFLNTLKYMGPGYGYWINLNADGVLQFGP